MNKVLIAASAVIFLSACEGDMQGVVRGSGERVLIKYQQGIDSDQLTAVIGSETFSGRAVMRDSIATIGTGFGTALGGGDVFTSSSQVFSQTSTGNFVAVLLGDKGNSMQCDLRYASAFGETTSGGVGVCNHTDGRMIDIVW